MTEKYVIRSEMGNTYISNTVNRIVTGWVEDINKAKVFNSLEEAADGLEEILSYFKNMRWNSDGINIHKVNEITTLSIGEKITVDSKKDVLFILKAIRDAGLKYECDVKYINRAIAYVTMKGT